MSKNIDNSETEDEVDDNIKEENNEKEEQKDNNKADENNVKPNNNTNKDNNESSNEDTIPSNLDEWIEEKKLHFVKIALKESNNNLQLASRKLGVTYSRLHYFVEKNKLINDSQ